MTEQLNFSMSGEFLTDLARTWYFDEHKDYEKSERLLLSCMMSSDDSEEILQYKKQIALDIIEGRKRFIGINNLTLVDEPCGYPVRLVQVEELARKLKLIQEENEKLNATILSQQEVIRVTKEVSDGYRGILDRISERMKAVAERNNPVYKLRVHFSRSNMLDPHTKQMEIIGGSTVTEEMGKEIADLCKKANIYPAERRYGFWEWMSFYDCDTNELMSTEDLIDRGFAIVEPEEEVEEKEEKEKQEEVEYVEDKLGWLSPSGDFYESPWGTHEDSALKIVESNNWRSGFRDWKRDHIRSTGMILARDYLVYEKGWILLDNPLLIGGRPRATMSDESRITKKQRDFLYGYFFDIGDTLMANRFMES